MKPTYSLPWVLLTTWGPLSKRDRLPNVTYIWRNIIDVDILKKYHPLAINNDLSISEHVSNISHGGKAIHTLAAASSHHLHPTKP